MASFMQNWFIYMPFLYFPEDKSEYIPAFISMSIFMLVAVGFFIFIKRISRKQEEKTKEMEERINRERGQKHP